MVEQAPQPLAVARSSGSPTRTRVRMSKLIPVDRAVDLVDFRFVYPFGSVHDLLDVISFQCDNPLQSQRILSARVGPSISLRLPSTRGPGVRPGKTPRTGARPGTSTKPQRTPPRGTPRPDTTDTEIDPLIDVVPLSLAQELINDLARGAIAEMDLNVLSQAYRGRQRRSLRTRVIR